MFHKFKIYQKFIQILNIILLNNCASSLDNLSIDTLRKKLEKNIKDWRPPYSKWTKQQLIDHLNDNDTETVNSSNIVKLNSRKKKKNKKIK